MDSGQATATVDVAMEADAEEVAALPQHYFELSGLAVEMAGHTSGQRVTPNTLFVTINTGLAARLGANSFSRLPTPGSSADRTPPAAVRISQISMCGRMAS
jgi:hypothetical protein